jgi:predicted NUDIX family NTP pyrophosphohydrolase
MLKKTVLVHALSIAFGGAALGVAVMSPAMAQSNASGSVFGTVAPGSNVQILIENPDIGIRRTLTPDAQGRFVASSLPSGVYRVTQLRDGANVATVEVETGIGRNGEAIFAGAPAAGGAQVVQVSARRATIDTSSAGSSATFNARELASLPIGRNIESIIQLAPNTTTADTRFAGGASFGGGAASENSYYINGFPVTNPLTGLGAAQLPFGAIAEAQVLTGGFGAEFGRSIGGVVNIVTKSGTNTWEAGGLVTWEPKSLRATPYDIYYGNTGTPNNAATDGTLRLARAENTVDRKVYGAYVGGPIIKDKLFFFAAAEKHDTEEGLVNGFRVATNNASVGWRDRDTKVERYMAKLDWNITDNHRIEFTTMGDTPEVSYADSGFDYATRTRNNTVTSTQQLVNVDNNGAKLNTLRYVGNLTDDLTVTALYGRSKSTHENYFTGYNPDLFQISSTVDARAPGLSYANPQNISGNILAPGSEDIVDSGRFDVEWRLGRHTLRGGFDQTKVESVAAGEYLAGGGRWTYYRATDPTAQIEGPSGVMIPSPASTGGALATRGYYVTRDQFSTVTNSFGEQSAWYLEDRFQATPNLLLTLGVRNESFKNQNDSKTTFLEMKNQIQPRLAAVWDVNGDASLKVYGTLGRYSVPIPTHISVRGAGRSTYTNQYYAYTGTDANGAPTGLVQLSEPLSSNNEYGQDKVVETLAARDMDPQYQDELTFGFEKAFSPSLNFGAKGIYRKMRSTIDDFCDVRPFERFAEANGIEITNPLWGNTCQTFNPGEDNEFLVDFSGDTSRLTQVNLTAADQGFDKPKRTYKSIETFLEHPFRNGWYAKASYTWSSNKGNTEGQVRSDNGQADVAVTSSWDYPELMEGAYGYLPNHRKHQLKAFGFYEVTPEVVVGANVLIASGRPRSCIGSAANPGDSPNYANQTFYCGGLTRSENVLTPRGTVGNLPWEHRYDLNVAYRPNFVKGLQFRVDVFNVFNSQVVRNVTEAYNNGANVSGLYQTPLSLTSPRYARFSLMYDRKF